VTREALFAAIHAAPDDDEPIERSFAAQIAPVIEVV